jgi:hypothetical protein
MTVFKEGTEISNANERYKASPVFLMLVINGIGHTACWNTEAGRLCQSVKTIEIF